MAARGRALEELVCNLEDLLARTSVKVRSPDFLLGQHSGVLREVDVTLRGMIGSSEILVIIECRDRKYREDVRWIEQLSAKRDDVGASNVIAVSRSGFSPAATALAHSKNIGLRTF